MLYQGGYDIIGDNIGIEKIICPPGGEGLHFGEYITIGEISQSGRSSVYGLVSLASARRFG